MERFQDMAERSFGFGTWEAPYWFLGPEQGMSKNENELEKRYIAWRNLGSHELDDCIEFHQLLPPKRNKRGKRKDNWHGDPTNTQTTWSRLIQFMIGFGVHGVTDHLEYQKRHWGTRAGETCVAELSGLAAHNLAVKRDRDSFLPTRLTRLSEALNGKQEIVLLYGRTSGCKIAWDHLTKETIPIGRCSRGEAVHRKGNTLFVHSQFHPAGPGQSYETWRQFGQEVKKLQQVA